MGEIQGGKNSPSARILRHFAVYLALTTVAIGQPLLQLYGENLAVFASARYQGSIVVWFALAVLMAPALVLLAIDTAASLLLPRYEQHVHHALVFFALWLAVMVILRSISFGPWVIDGLFTAAIASAVLFAYHSLSAIKQWLTLLSPIALVVGVVFGFAASDVIIPPKVQVLALNNTSGSSQKSIVQRNDVSVLWINMDEAPLWPLLNKTGDINASRFPGFAALANAGTWYRNVTGTSEMTTIAVPSILTGKWPLTSHKSPLLASHPKNLFTLMNGHIAFDVHEIATALCPYQVCNKISVSGGDDIATANASSAAEDKTTISGASRTGFISFLKDALVVTGHKILPEGLRKKLPAIDESWGGFLGESGNKETASTPITTTTAKPSHSGSSSASSESIVPKKPNTITNWEKNHAASQVPVVQEVVARAARASIPTLHFAHILLPHKPWLLAPDLRYSLPITDDPRITSGLLRRKEVYQSFLRQYIAFDKIVDEMVTSLKASANWDRTMIVVTADHGLTFMPGVPQRAPVNGSIHSSLEDIYRVPLFIKYPGQQAGDINDCTATSVDILPTVIAATGIDAGWKLDGADLAKSCPVRTARPIIWRGGSGTLTTGVDALLKRVDYYDKWITADGNVDDIFRSGLSGSLIGTSVPATAESEDKLTWKLYDRESYNNIGTGPLSLVVTRSRGTLTAHRDFSSKEEGLLVVDGVVVGIIDELARLKAGQTTFWGSAPNTRFLRPGIKTVEFWTADWTTSTPVLRRVK